MVFERTDNAVPDIDDGEYLHFGDGNDWGIQYNASQGRLEIVDKTNGEDRAYLNDNGTWQFVSRPVDLNGLDIEDAGTVIYDSSDGAIENTDIKDDAGNVVYDVSADTLKNLTSITTDALTFNNQVGASGDFWGVGPTGFSDSENTFSTTSTSYVSTEVRIGFIWDRLPTNAQGAVQVQGQLFNSTGDVRLQNQSDGATVGEQTNFTGAIDIVTNYTPPQTSSRKDYFLQIRTDDGGSSSNIVRESVTFGVTL